MKGPRRLDVLVLGGINTDFIAQGSALPKPGESISGEKFFSGAGGKGANQAVAAARLGARVALVGCVGRDARGDELLDTLRSQRVDVSSVIRHDKAQTGAAVIMVDENGEKQIMTGPGANQKLSVRSVHEAFERFAKTRVVLMQLEIPFKTVLAAARLAQKAGAKVILDPAPPIVMPGDDLLRLLDVIRPNSSEAEALTKIRVTDPHSARRAARQLLKRGVKAVAVQAGEHGNLLVWGEGERLFPKFKVKAIDATGAGDAFAAGLAVALAEGRSFVEAGLMASAAAALATTKLGAQSALPRRKELERFVKRNAPTN